MAASAEEANAADESAGVSAVVVTYRRPRLATAVVRGLVDQERIPVGRIVLVVNGEGGLTDPTLEAAIRVVHLPDNLGPAGGFRAGLAAAFEDPAVDWAYLCEDDVGLFNLPGPRVARVVGNASAHRPEPVGAVVAYGRCLTGRSGATLAFVPGSDGPSLEPVDVAAWGATLVSRAVIESGVWPDPALFFGYEDFDFFFKVRQAGFSVLVDRTTALAVADRMTLAGRDQALSTERPVDADESWRAYYVARNFFAIARRHGQRRWLAWHLVYSLRRLQLSASGVERRAMLWGLWDGIRGRMGRNPRFQRQTGEWARH